MQNRNKIIIGLIIALIITSLFLVIGMTNKNYEYLLSRRLPKLLAILVTSVAIAISSIIFQTISNNRILTPSILGLDSLYILIQTSVIFILGSGSSLVLNGNLNFMITVGLMIVFSMVLYGKLLDRENSDIFKLLLVGIILGTLFESVSNFMQMMIDPNEFQHIQDKMFASFNSINTEVLLISSLIVIGISIYLFTRSDDLDVLALGRDVAINLGLNHNRILKEMIFLVAILVSISTVLVGPITFLGLLVVNLAREMLDTYKHRYLMVMSSILGIIALVGGQLIVERIFNFSTPISVVINLIGGIYFIYLLLKESRA